MTNPLHDAAMAALTFAHSALAYLDSGNIERKSRLDSDLVKLGATLDRIKQADLDAIIKLLPPDSGK